MVFAGGPNEVADRILKLHEQLGHSRQILQMDVGGMPHAMFLKSARHQGPAASSQLAHHAIAHLKGTLPHELLDHGQALVRWPDRS
jgi:hypothetical protein